MDIQLKDKVFFVTGGSRGIGKSVVLNLLEEGAYVGTCSRSQKELNDLKNSLDTQLQSRLIVRSCDIRDFESVKISVNNTVEEFGKLNGIVSNAGYGSSGTVLETSNEEWLSQYEIKLSGLMNLVNVSVLYLKKTKDSKIVIMNGITAEAPDINMAVVSASRAGVKQVSKMLAIELSKYNICVNSVNIGAIQTGRQVKRFKEAKTVLNYLDWEKEEAKKRGILFNRFGRIEEVVPAVLFLLSPLSSYITASSIDITGGLHPRL